MNLYDTHFHLDLQKDRKKALDRIVSQKIYTIAMTNLPDLYRKEVDQYHNDYIRIALGFHPELIKEYKHQIPLMWELLPSVRYVGEVGLDFSNNDNRGVQIKFFEDLIERCHDTNKILSIHSRKAESVVLDIIGESFSFKPILHWFSGNVKEAEIAINRGYYFSVNTKMLTTKKFNQMIRIIPKDRILLETDSPFVNSDSDQFEMLSAISKVLEAYKIDYWQNFRLLLNEK